MNQILQTRLDEVRGRVEKLAGLGATEEDIAAELQIPVKRLRKRFRRELARGNAIGKHQVLEKFFDQVQSGSNMGATTLWVKARCGWRDTGAASHSAPTINSVLRIIAPVVRDAPATPPDRDAQT
jgi:hypothetical protein